MQNVPFYYLIDFTYVYVAFFVLALLVTVLVLRKKFNIDVAKIIADFILKRKNGKNSVSPIVKSTGVKSLVLMDAGANKATVLATLRQIMNLDYETAKSMVESAPTTIVSNISEQEANLNKQALEFVGAKLVIK